MSNNSFPSPCIGPLVIAVTEFDDFENSTILVDCISARQFYKPVYDAIQWGGIGIFSVGILINLVYFIRAQLEVKKWTRFKEINLQLLIAALCHVIWLSTDMLSFHHILPIFPERLFRDIPCWIIVSVAFHFLVIWNSANSAAQIKHESPIFNHRNAYLFQFVITCMDVTNRLTQHILNDPAQFATYESVFMIMLSFSGILFFLLSSILLFQVRKLAMEIKYSQEGSPQKFSVENKIIKFYEAMKKFYFIISPAAIFLSVLGFAIVGTKIIYLAVVIAAEHFWSVAAHIFCWIALNYILWQFSFKKKKESNKGNGKTTSGTGENSTSTNNQSTSTKTGNNEAASAASLLPQAASQTFRYTYSHEEPDLISPEKNDEEKTETVMVLAKKPQGGGGGESPQYPPSQIISSASESEKRDGDDEN